MLDSGCSVTSRGEMDSEKEGKKLNDDLVVFMRKRSETDAPRYTARLKTYVDIQEKRKRAAAARKRSEHANRKADAEKDKPIDSSDRQGGDEENLSRRRGANCEKRTRSGSFSGSRSQGPTDRCCPRRRRRRCSRRRRRRSCRRRRRSCRRRRRSCRRRRTCCRRRRRSCRRRRRRSCRRRRRRCR